MISAVNISLHFGSRALFDEIAFAIGPRDRIGLVGSNGAGKTTLLRILLGEIQPDAGSVNRARYVTVGYLPQEGMAVAGQTLVREVESAFGTVLDLQDRLEQARAQMEMLAPDSPDLPETLEVYGELQHKLEASDAFRMKATVEKVLMGLGFSRHDFERRTEEFSGGWQMRIALAKLLLMQPSLLLLDEPTNHLDLDSLQWLEEYIRAYEGAVMIVSHDQRFLDNMTNRIFELSLSRLTEYAGNFSAYLQTSAARKEQILSAYKNQQQQIKQTERFIERFRYKATKARQVQSRVKQLEKLERIELEDEEEGIRFTFPPSPPSGRVVLELRSVDKSYGPLRVFQNLSFEIERGERIALVGVNGAGKSTLARMIAGVEEIDAGERITGHNVVISYFAQHQAEELDPTCDVLQTVDDAATGDIRRLLRSLLGAFLFSGDDVYKSVRVLSGGEKSRLALAKMLLRPANLIVLDEPTNHLDMRSKLVLQDALLEYEGSCVIVSHDRDFLDPLVSRVVEVRNGSYRTYLGNVSEYIETRNREEQAGQGADATRGVPEGGASGRERKRREAELRQKRYEHVKPVQDAIAEVERTIEEQEDRLRTIESLMAGADIYRTGEKVRDLTAEYRQLKDALNNAYHRWNDLNKELERLQKLYSGTVNP